MGFLERMVDVIENVKNDVKENDGLLDDLKDTLKKTDIGSTIDMFKKKGLGDTVMSWVSTGANKPISSEEVREVFGENTIKEFAQKSGTSKESISSRLSDVLPHVFDKSTPNGKIDD